MEQDLYSVEQVADLLNLHVKTVRGYVRDGRLKAVRIGKQYRIAAEDLAAMTGRPVASFRPEPVQRSRYIEVSSIVEIDAISPEAAGRLSTLLTGGARGRGEDDQPLRVESIYNAERARLKIILAGSMATVRLLLGMITTLLEQI